MKPSRAQVRGDALIADPTRWQWADDAACADHPWELFYGPADEEESLSAQAAREVRAKQVCEDCPLTTWKTCLERALIPGPKAQHGVQGGHTAAERIVIRHNRMRKDTGRSV